MGNKIASLILITDTSVMAKGDRIIASVDRLNLCSITWSKLWEQRKHGDKYDEPYCVGLYHDGNYTVWCTSQLLKQENIGREFCRHTL